MPTLKTLAGKIAAYVAMLILAAYWVTAGAQRNWGITIPDDFHTYGIRNRRGADLFFRPEVGWFIEHGFWIFLAAAAVAVVVEVVARLLVKPAPASDDTRMGLR
jgi:hypothetical protein